LELGNAKQFPKTYYAKHMQAGICGYKTEKILIEADQMKEMAPSFVGKPIYVNHQKVDLENLKQQAAGYISDSFYNELDGWLWVKFVVIDDAAHDAIMRGWAVSNAYVPTQWDEKGGLWHNIPYDRRIMAGDFTHLAIVDDPRYEGACILSPDGFKSYQAEKKQKLNELTNKKEPSTMFSFFKTKREPVTADKIDADTMVEIDGAVISVQEMVNSVAADKAAKLAAEKKNSSEDDDAKKKADEEKMNSEIEVGDETMTLKDLVSAYNSLKNAKKNSADADSDDKKKAEEAKAAEEKANSKAAESKAAEAKAKEITNKAEGRKSYDELRNAHLKVAASPAIETGQDKTARGQSRYGSN